MRQKQHEEIERLPYDLVLDLIYVLGQPKFEEQGGHIQAIRYSIPLHEHHLVGVKMFMGYRGWRIVGSMVVNMPHVNAEERCPFSRIVRVLAYADVTKQELWGGSHE